MMVPIAPVPMSLASDELELLELIMIAEEIMQPRLRAREARLRFCGWPAYREQIAEVTAESYRTSSANSDGRNAGYGHSPV